MKSFTAIAVLSSIAHALAQSSVPILNTPPSLIQCQPALLTFNGGTAPYFLTVLPAGQVAGTPIAFLPDQPAAGSYTWVVNLPVGTNITISIRDGAGQLNYAAPLVIQAGASDSCVSASASSAAAGATATGSVAPAVVGVSSLATTPAPTPTGTVVATGTSATVTAASGTPSSTINGTSATFNFTCPQGFLTYGITVAELETVSLRQAVSYFGNWTGNAPGTLVNSTGRGLNATRAYTITGNVTLGETLRLNATNATTGALHQQWNATNATPVTLGPLVLYNSFDDLTIYSNETSNTTSIQYFILGCFNDQASGLTTLASFINGAVDYWAGQITGIRANASANATATMPARVRRIVRLA